jgi:hypothetical protein
MALQPITHTDPTPVTNAPQADMSAPADAPNYDNMSADELAKVIGQSGQGGQGIEPTLDPEQQAAMAKDNQAKTPKPAEPPIPIPDKFKNQDGSPKIEALVKSQVDTQSYASRVTSENEQLRAERDQLIQLGEDMQKELAAAQATPPMSQPGEQMTDAEVEEYNANPKAYMAKLMKQELSQMNKKIEGQRQEGHRDRMLDFKVNTARNKIQNMEGYKDLEEDINGILNSNVVGWDPRGPELAYYAARGMRTTQMVVDAKNMGFTEGYNRAKEELTRQVSPGGGSTLPAGGKTLDAETIDNMTPEQMVAAGLVQVHPSK